MRLLDKMQYHKLKTFKEVCDITGLVLTKLDGTAKGGVVLAVKSEVDVPVKLIGVRGTNGRFTRF